MCGAAVVGSCSGAGIGAGSDVGAAAGSDAGDSCTIWCRGCRSPTSSYCLLLA